jgi:hypothetical protein
VVSEGDGRDFAGGGGASEKVVPELSGRHFNRKLLGLGKTANIFAANQKGELEFPCGSADESFIGIAAAAAELVVQVGDGEFPTFLG